MTSKTSTCGIFKTIVELKDNEYIKINNNEVFSSSPIFKRQKRLDKSFLNEVFQAMLKGSDNSLSLKDWDTIKTKIEFWYQKRFDKLAWWQKLAEWLTSFFVISEIDQSYKTLINHLDQRKKRVGNTEKYVSLWENTISKEKQRLISQEEETVDNDFILSNKTIVEKKVTEFKDDFFQCYLTEISIEIQRQQLEIQKKQKEESWALVKGLFDVCGISQKLDVNEVKKLLRTYRIYKTKECFRQAKDLFFKIGEVGEEFDKGILEKRKKFDDLELLIAEFEKFDEEIKILIKKLSKTSLKDESKIIKEKIFQRLCDWFSKQTIFFDLIWKESRVESLFQKDPILDQKMRKFLLQYLFNSESKNKRYFQVFCRAMSMDCPSKNLQNIFCGIKEYISTCKNILDQGKGDYDGSELLSFYKLFKAIDDLKKTCSFEREIDYCLAVDELIEKFTKELNIVVQEFVKEGKALEKRYGMGIEVWEEWRKCRKFQKEIRDHQENIVFCQNGVKKGDLTTELLEKSFPLLQLENLYSKSVKQYGDLYSKELSFLKLIEGLRKVMGDKDESFVSWIEKKLKMHGNNEKALFWTLLCGELEEEKAQKEEEMAQKEYDLFITYFKNLQPCYPLPQNEVNSFINQFKKYQDNTPNGRTPLLKEEEETLYKLALGIQKEIEAFDKIKTKTTEILQEINDKKNVEDTSKLKDSLLEILCEAFFVCPRLTKSLWTISNDQLDIFKDLGYNWEDRYKKKEKAQKAIQRRLDEKAEILWGKFQEDEEDLSSLQLELQLAFNAFNECFAGGVNLLHIPYWSVGLKYGEDTYYITKVNPEEWKEKSETIYKLFDDKYEQKEEEVKGKIFKMPFSNSELLGFLNGKRPIKMNVNEGTVFYQKIAHLCKIVDIADFLGIPKKAMETFYDQSEGSEIEWLPDGGISLTLSDMRRHKNNDFVDMLNIPYIQRNLMDLTLQDDLPGDIKGLALALSSCERLRNLTTRSYQNSELVENIAKIIHESNDQVFPSLNAIITNSTESIFKKDVRKQLKQDRPKLLLLKKKE